jgi:hypothetical protein
MRNLTRSLYAISLFLFLLSNVSFIPVCHAVSITIVISEFRTRGLNGGNDEFIELYNLSASPVDISGWLVKGSNNSGTVTTRAIINDDTILNPGCHYLLTNSNPIGGPYSDLTIGDQTYGVGITNNGGIALTLPDGTIVDQIGLGNGSAFFEDLPLGPLTTDKNRGYERKPGWGSNGQDTDINRNDFQFVMPSNPQIVADCN